MALGAMSCYRLFCFTHTWHATVFTNKLQLSSVQAIDMHGIA
jgi:hypothetical protein